MGRKRDHFGWVEIRLEYWGKDVAKNIHGLGYASRTIEGKMSDGELIGATTNYREHAPHIDFAHKERETGRAIDKMPDEWKWIVYRRHVDGKTPDEIRKQVGRSIRWMSATYDNILSFLAAGISYESKMNQNMEIENERHNEELETKRTVAPTWKGILR